MKVSKVLQPLLAIGIVAGLALASLRASELLSAKPYLSIPTIEVTRSSHPRFATAEGLLESEKSTSISVPRSSQRRFRIAWLKKDGAKVAKGEVVVRFDTAEATEKLASGQESKEKIGYDLAIERAQRNSAGLERERQRILTRLDLETAKSRHSSVDDEIFSRNELLSSSIDRELSEAKVVHANATGRMHQRVSLATSKLLDIQERAAKVSIQTATKDLAEMEVTAPHDGLLIYEYSGIKVGASVYRGQTIAKLPLISSMQAKVFVLESDVKGLTKGAQASFIIESAPQTEYKATIERISTLPTKRHEEVPTQYFSVFLKPEATNIGTMKPGQRVMAKLHKEALRGIIVPRQCVYEIEGDMVVFRESKGTFEAVKVKLGAGTPGLVVIKEGLSEGDRIATQDPFGETKREKESASDSSGAPANPAEAAP